MKTRNLPCPGRQKRFPFCVKIPIIVQSGVSLTQLYILGEPSALSNLQLFCFIGKCLDKIEQVSPQDHDDHPKIEHHFCPRTKVSLRGKHLERIVCRMEQDTGDQRLPVIKNQHQHEADQNGKYDLGRGRSQLPSASVEQIHDMAETEGQSRYDNGCLQVVLSIALNSSPRKMTSSRKPTQHMLMKYSSASGKPYCSLIPPQKAVDAMRTSGR